ncbi:MAG: efflux RND transporter periplasmic adaptor subunit [Deltaproteobacteria bacterium]|nr:efflux RND transporter periplasmic adaptor subunit [Deltaproteobacteria bacterium]
MKFMHNSPTSKEIRENCNSRPKPGLGTPPSSVRGITQEPKNGVEKNFLQRDKTAFLVLFLFASLLLASCSSGKQVAEQAPQVEVKAVRVVRGNVDHLIQATGRVDVLKKVEINSPVEGVVTELLVKEGDFVRKGSVVARLRPIEAEAAIRGSAAISGVKKQYFLRLGMLALSSPFNGYVSRRYVSSNALVQANAPIVAVEDLSSTYLHVDLPSLYLEQVKIGDTVLIHFLSFPNDVFAGRIVTINPTVSRETQTVALNVNFPNNKQEIKDGMFAVVDIISSTHKNTLVVPKDAILFDPDTGREYVMVVGQDLIARDVTVTTGYEEDDKVEILSGLSQGQLVITQGNYALAGGTAVKVETDTIMKTPK